WRTPSIHLPIFGGYGIPPKDSHRLLPRVVLRVNGLTHPGIFPHTSYRPLQGKVVSRLLLDRQVLGCVYSPRNGFLPQDQVSTEAETEKQLYAGGQPHLYERYHADAGLYETPLRFCRKKGTRKDPHFRILL